MQKIRLNSKKRTNLKAILLGLCLTLILHLVLSLPGAAVINTVKKPLAAVGIVGIIIHLICGVITAFALCKYKPDGAIISSLFSSLLFFALSLPIGIFAGDGGVPLRSAINSGFYVAECTICAAIFKLLSNKKR